MQKFKLYLKIILTCRYLKLLVLGYIIEFNVNFCEVKGISAFERKLMELKRKKKFRFRL